MSGRMDTCACGCGSPRPRYVHGHDRRTFLEYAVEDRGYETPCWIVNVAAKKGVYAQIRLNGRHVGAHRVSYERAKGPIPDGHHLDHLCRVPRCINPDHLEVVTPGENIRRQPRTKLNPDLVREIRASEESGRQIAARLGVSRALITLVRQRKLWADVE